MDTSQTLGVTAFGLEARPARLGDDCPFLAIGLQDLDAVRSEVWSCNDAVRRATVRGISLSQAGGVLFGTLAVDSPPGSDLTTLARDAYARVFATVAESGCPTIVRIHNYIPGIVDVENGIERYRAFNIGRYEAFTAAGRQQVMPAATGIGAGVGISALSISFLAIAGDSAPVENPRQIPAYSYPERYGPRSPMFSRATIALGKLFVSGTASIVGHESLHPGDAAAQTDEAMRNIAALLAQCSARGLRTGQPDQIKAYVRNPDDAASVRARLPAEAVLLRATLCRPELLVEIEGVLSVQSSSTCNASPEV